MREHYKLQAHCLDVDILETTPGRFRWMYLIDGNYFRASLSALESEGLARADALGSAEERIRWLDRVGQVWSSCPSLETANA